MFVILIVPYGVSYLFPALSYTSTNIVLPTTAPNGKTVVEMTDSAFGVYTYNSNIVSVHIPPNYTKLGINPFINCANLTSITVDENNKNYRNWECNYGGESN